ncbi:MAG: cytochrome c [Bacteroidota bacterium]
MITLSIITVVTLLFGFVIANNEPVYSESVSEIPEPFCGTEQFTENESLGREVFLINCAACHHLTKKRTGPSLRDKFRNNRYPSNSYFGIYVTKEDSLLNAKDPYAIAINEAYSGYEYSHQFNLTEEDLKLLIEYIR